MDDGKKVEGESVIDISCLAHLRLEKVLSVLVDSIEASVRLLVDSGEIKKSAELSI